MNSYLHGDAWTSVPTQYHTKIKEMTTESQVTEPARTFYFGEENSWAIPGISGAGMNDNNLRSTPNGTTDCFATFHKPPSGDLNNGVSFACVCRRARGVRDSLSQGQHVHTELARRQTRTDVVSRQPRENSG